MRIILALWLVLFSIPVFGLDIPASCYVKNERPGYCCWVSLEILGKVHGISKLDNIFENRKKEADVFFWNGSQWELHPKNLGYNYALRNKLTKLGVKFQMQDSGKFDRSLLKHATSQGCLVGVKPGAIPGYKQSHGIIITEYNNGVVKFFDCNKPKKLWVASKEWFDYYWTGLIVVVEK